MKLPVHPRIGRMLCEAADTGCVEEGAILAAILSEKDTGRQRTAAASAGDSDLLARMDDPGEDVRCASAELLRVGRRLGHEARTPPVPATLLKLPLLAYPDRVCRRRERDPSSAVTVGGGGVRLDRESVVRESEYFLALDRAAIRGRKIRKRWCGPPARFAWNGCSKCFRSRSFGSKSRSSTSSASASSAGGSCDIAIWFCRRKWTRPLIRLTQGKSWPRRCGRVRPTFSRATNLQGICSIAWPCFAGPCPSIRGRSSMPRSSGKILGELCAGKRSVEEVRRLPLAEALESRLGYPLDQILRREAPEIIEVPSGSKLRLEYRGEQSPILAVRLAGDIFVAGHAPDRRRSRGRVLAFDWAPIFARCRLRMTCAASGRPRIFRSARICASEISQAFPGRKTR